MINDATNPTPAPPKARLFTQLNKAERKELKQLQKRFQKNGGVLDASADELVRRWKAADAAYRSAIARHASVDERLQLLEKSKLAHDAARLAMYAEGKTFTDKVFRDQGGIPGVSYSKSATPQDRAEERWMRDIHASVEPQTSVRARFAQQQMAYMTAGGI